MYHSNTNNMHDIIEDIGNDDKLGQGFSSVDKLEEVDIRDGMTQWPTYINTAYPRIRRRRYDVWYENLLIVLRGNILKCEGFHGNQ
jgi:hypothetical protein